MDEKELAIRKIHVMLPKEEPLPKIESVSAETQDVSFVSMTDLARLFN